MSGMAIGALVGAVLGLTGAGVGTAVSKMLKLRGRKAQFVPMLFVAVALGVSGPLNRYFVQPYLEAAQSPASQMDSAP